jgi:hypothetical protein
MTATASTRLAVLKNGRPRCVLSIAEKRSGDLILNLRSSQLSSIKAVPFGVDIPMSERGEPIRDYRYSVHMSSKSSSGVNTIKLHHLLTNGKYRTAIQYTSAIKRSDHFTLLYAKRCSRMDGPGYDLKKTKDAYCDLGTIGDEFTLCFSVFVGSSSRPFYVPYGPDFQCRQLIFKEFSLVVMYSFLSLPPHDNFGLSHAVTPTGGDPSPGYNEAQCVSIFDHLRYQMKEQHIGAIESQAPELVDAFMRAAIFFREARTDSREFREWSNRLKLGRII